MDIALNSLVTFSAQGEAGGFVATMTNWTSTGVTDAQTAITTSLRNYGLSPVLVNLNATNWVPNFAFPWTGTIAIRPSYTTDDIGLTNQVAAAIQDATGYAAVLSMQSVQDASTPDPTMAQPSSISDTITTTIASAASALGSETNKLLLGAAIIVVVVVLVVGYGPNVKKLSTVSL
jgi:hydroxypyruvate isomerase